MSANIVQGLASGVLAALLLIPTAPVQASEVVKLARLIVTGKRISSDVQMQRLPPVVVHGRRASEAEGDQLAAGPDAGGEARRSGYWPRAL
ncbi:hypothetical protein LZ017_21115 [Pelomonas sp. CA6]|uniref:hypothetical protein n=1 Tax=Pelomonas sp. CA6 TaxID=2907999 RepID=UPI001F4C1E48|nr:hypothetical protein [Pelomonas sp. CA6]MCH7345878.1 hypothetical protein [Pelomonas sp. CA6]